MAMSEAGMQTISMCFSSMPAPPRRSVLITAAVAADTDAAYARTFKDESQYDGKL